MVAPGQSSTAAVTPPSADSILESLTDGVLVLDAGWRLTYLNAAGERVLGRARAELVGHVLWERFPELEGTAFGQAYRRAMADRSEAAAEAYYPPFEAWFEARAIPRGDGGLTLLFRDVTRQVEARRAGEALALDVARQGERLAQWERLFDHAGWGVITTLPDGTLTAVNPAFARMHGYASPDELVGRNLAETFAPESQAGVSGHVATVYGTGHHTYESIHRRKDGSTFPCLADVIAVKDAAGEVRYRAANLQDLTARKAAEAEREALLARERSAHLEAEQQKALLDLVIEQIGEGIIVSDEHGVLRVFNPAAERMHGATKQEIEAPDWAQTYGLFTLDDRPLPLEATPLFRAVQGERVENAYWKVRRPDGEVRTLRGTATPLTRPDGSRAGGVLVTHDETQRLAADEAARVQAVLQARRARHALLAGDVGFALTRGGAIHETLQRCAESMVRHLDAALARIWTLDADQAVLELQASAGLYTHLDGPHARVPVGQLEIGLIARDRAPHLTNDVPDDARFGDPAWARREGLVAFAGYPLLVEGRVVGVMAMFARQRLEADVLDALAMVADPLALGIERARAEAARRVSETRYLLATRATKDAIWDWDLVTNAVSWNEGVEALFGHPLRDIPPVNTWWYEHVHPEDCERVIHGIHEVIDSGRRDWHDEYRFARADGTYALVTDRGFISHDASGRPVRMVGAMQDVTAARRSQEALAESERQFRTLADSIPHLAWMANADGHIFWYNQRWYDYTGTTLEEMAGWGWKSVHDPSLLDAVVERWTYSLTSGKPFELEFPLRRHDGVFRWHLTRATPVRDARGTLVRWFGTNTDIDEQRRLRERQQFLAEASKELARSLADRSTLRGIVRLALPGLADWAAIDVLDERGHLHRLAAERVHDAEPPELARPLELVLGQGRTQCEPERFLIVPIQSGGRVLGALTLVNARRSRRYAAADVELMEELASRAGLALENSRLFGEVRELNESLERRVRERTAELQEAVGELESFTYSISHDLRAPLRHITGFAQLLEKRAAAALDDKSRGYVRTISEAAQRGGELVDDLLAFSRLGRAELRKAPVALGPLVEEVKRELGPEWEGRQVEWRVGPLPWVLGDANLLRAALQNLLANALKYSRTRAQAIIEVGACERDSEVEVAVKDNGVGFDMRYVDKLFGVFQRLHTTEQFEGTGIGLANVRRIVLRHGGRVWAEGAVGQGAAFYFTLPKLAAGGGAA